jgi:hypothetical protein
LKVQLGGRFEKVEVTADGNGLAAHAGSGLLVAVADKVGLTDAFCEELAQTRERRSAHDPGAVVRDLCVMLADGGDCVSDLGALRDQEDLFGQVASHATVFRVIDSLSKDGMLDCLRAAGALARLGAGGKARAGRARPRRDADHIALRPRSVSKGWSTVWWAGPSGDVGCLRSPWWVRVVVIAARSDSLAPLGPFAGSSRWVGFGSTSQRRRPAHGGRSA